MKKPLLIAASLLISVAAFAQKKELKEIELLWVVYFSVLG